MLSWVCGKCGKAMNGKINLFRRHGTFFGQAMHENRDSLLPVHFMEAIEQTIIYAAVCGMIYYRISAIILSS